MVGEIRGKQDPGERADGGAHRSLSRRDSLEGLARCDLHCWSKMLRALSTQSKDQTVI